MTTTWIWKPDQRSYKWKKSPNSCKSLLYTVNKDFVVVVCSTENWLYISVHTASNPSELTNMTKMEQYCLLILKSNQYINIWIRTWNESTNSIPGNPQVWCI